MSAFGSFNRHDKRFIGQQTSFLPLNYTQTYYPNGRYPFETTQYPDFDGFGGRVLNLPRVIGYNNRPSNLVYPNLLPKVRAIFFPVSPIPVHQPYAGPLTVPPFFFNCMSQPLCSLPLPPPLPPPVSLCLENNIQQLLMQRYANPVAVFPVNPNWQIPQPSFPSYQPAPMPSSVPIYPPQRTPQFQNNSYPRTICMCVPESSSMQYSPATTNPNIQPNDNRITPLLGHPKAPPPEQNHTKQQQYSNSYISEANSWDSWSQKTPPLPPGAILISDEYIDKKDQHSKIPPKASRHTGKPTRRSILINTNNTNWISPRKNHSFSDTTETESDIPSRHSFAETKSAASSRSPYSVSVNESVKPEKTITGSTEKSGSVNQKQLPTESSNVNISNLTATDDAISHANSDALRDLRLSLAMRDKQLDLPPAVRENSTVKNEEKHDKNTNVSTRTTSSFHSKSRNTKSNSLIERETARQTPSTFRPTSRTTVTSGKDTNFDSVSQTSTIKTDKENERNISSTDTF